MTRGAEPGFSISRCVAAMVAVLGVGSSAVSAFQEPDAQKPIAKLSVSEAATRRFAAATALENREQFDQAADEWSGFLKDHPQDPRADRAQFHLGFCRLKNDRYPEAIESLQRLIAERPKSSLLASAWFHLGLAYYDSAVADGARGEKEHAAKSYALAAETFEKYLDKFPQASEAPRALFYRAESLFELGKKADAAKLYDDFARRYTSHEFFASALYGLGVAREELGEAEAAANAYQRYVKASPDDSRTGEVLVRWGRLLFDRGEFAAAAKRFAAAADRPNFPDADLATLRQAAALEALGDYGAAEKLLAGFATRYSASRHRQSAELAAGRVAYRAGRYAAARSALAVVIEAGGDASGEASHWLARVELAEKQPGAALKTIEAALPAGGQFANALRLDRADALYAIEDRRREAVGAYAALAAEHPADPLAPRALYMAAFAALGVGDFAQVQQYTEQFEKQYPKNDLLPDVLDVAAESQVRLGRHDRAADIYHRLLKDYPKHTLTNRWRVRLGLALFLGKKYAEAITALEPQLAALTDKRLSAEARYLIGRSQLELRQFEAAARSLGAALADDPASSRADDLLFALASAERQIDRGPSAAEHLRQLIERFPRSPLIDRARLSLAEEAYARGAFVDAAREYKQLIESLPASALVPDATVGLAWSQLGQKDFTSAEATLDALLAGHAPGNWTPGAHFVRGLARERLKQYGPASEDFRVFLDAGAAGRERSDARYALGLCQSRLEQYDPAADTFSALLHDDPNYAAADKVLRELAVVQEMQDDLAAAADSLRRLAKQHPASPLAAEALFHAGELELEQERTREAAICFDGAMRKAGKTPLAEKAAYHLGRAWFDQGEFEKARQTFAYQRAQFPRGPLADDAAFMLGEALVEQGKFAAAVAEYGKVRHPADGELAPLALLHWARADARQKRFGASLATLERAVRTFPKSEHLAELLIEQAWATQNIGKLDAARAIYERVAEMAEGELAARARFMVGDILAAQKQYAPAIENFTKTAYGYSAPHWQALAYYEAGRCHEALSQPADARKMYQELLDQFPDGERADEARERLKALDEQQSAKP